MFHPNTYCGNLCTEMRLLCCCTFFLTLSFGSGFYLRSTVLLRRIRSPDTKNPTPPSPSNIPFTPFRPVQNSNGQLPRVPSTDTRPSPTAFRPFNPVNQKNPPLQNPSSPTNPNPTADDRTNPFPPYPLQRQGASGIASSAGQQQQQSPLMAAIERSKSYKNAIDQAKNSPQNGQVGGQPAQGNISSLCVNRHEGQLQGQIGSSSSMDLNIQGWTKEGPYGFRSGSTFSQPAVFGANWAGPYYVHDC